jgi:hypothetical protein
MGALTAAGARGRRGDRARTDEGRDDLLRVWELAPPVHVALAESDVLDQVDEHEARAPVDHALCPPARAARAAVGRA